MTYSSRKTIISIILGLALIAAYIVFATNANAPAADDLKAWAVAILIFIGIAVVVQIVAAVLSRIVLDICIALKEKRNGKTDKEIERIVELEMKEDERDWTISLKAMRLGYAFAGIGIVVSLIALAFLGAQPLAALHIILGGVAIGSTAEGALSVFYHERGITNG